MLITPLFRARRHKLEMGRVAAFFPPPQQTSQKRSPSSSFLMFSFTPPPDCPLPLHPQVHCGSIHPAGVNPFSSPSHRRGGTPPSPKNFPLPSPEVLSTLTTIFPRLMWTPSFLESIFDPPELFSPFCNYHIFTPWAYIAPAHPSPSCSYASFPEELAKSSDPEFPVVHSRCFFINPRK